MKLSEFMEYYSGNACITINQLPYKPGGYRYSKTYCEEERYDYYSIPLDCFVEPDEEALSDNNPNHYKPSCLAKEPWWKEIKDIEIERWNVIGGGSYPVELTIELKDN